MRRKRKIHADHEERDTELPRSTRYRLLRQGRDVEERLKQSLLNRICGFVPARVSSQAHDRAQLR
jgi:hypothetical protein